MLVAIDLGGTQVRSALVRDGRIEKLAACPCNSNGTEAEVIGQICSLIDEVIVEGVRGIGIGVPSVVDVKEGIVYNVIGIPSWKEVHIKDILEARYGLPVRVNNDCNCYSLGVYHYGGAREYNDVVCMTLGTGVGCSLIAGGKLYSGHNAGAGEIGNVPYLDKDYEYYCSSRFFAGLGTSGKQAYEDALAGKDDALRLWDEFGRHVGRLVMMAMYAYDPEIIVFGGSIATAFDLFRKSMYEELKNFPYPEIVSRVVIEAADVEHAGILGAALLCMD